MVPVTPSANSWQFGMITLTTILTKKNISLYLYTRTSFQKFLCTLEFPGDTGNVERRS